jgi:hypothetical protein
LLVFSESDTLKTGALAVDVALSIDNGHVWVSAEQQV